jgi:hypothetical protein
MKSIPEPSRSESSRAKIEQFFGLSESAIDHQIEEHKYFINLAVPHELTRQQAFDSWSENVFSPLIQAMEEQELEKDFPGLGQDDLFLKVSEHWYFLKRDEDPNLSAERAVLSFGALHADDAISRSEYYLKLCR